MSASDKKNILRLAGKVKWAGNLNETRKSRFPDWQSLKKDAPMIIKTARFTLRPFRKSDLPSFVKHINDKTIAARTDAPIPYPYTMKDAEQWYRKMRNRARKKGSLVKEFAIDIDGEAVGCIAIFPNGHTAGIGYWLGRAYWNKGIMTEAVKEISKYGFNELGLRRIHASTFPQSKASMRVLEKAGYKFEGILRKNIKKGDKYIDEHLFAKVR
jgi:[ribosomal protein S5]-alanine N-acetyltransferase